MKFIWITVVLAFIGLAMALPATTVDAPNAELQSDCRGEHCSTKKVPDSENENDPSTATAAGEGEVIYADENGMNENVTISNLTGIAGYYTDIVNELLDIPAATSNHPPPPEPKETNHPQASGLAVEDQTTTEDNSPDDYDDTDAQFDEDPEDADIVAEILALEAEAAENGFTSIERDTIDSPSSSSEPLSQNAEVEAATEPGNGDKAHVGQCSGWKWCLAPF